MIKILIIFTVMAIVGAIYVARGRALVANCLWSVSNLAFIIHNIMIHQYEMLILFGVYELISLYGVWNLTRHKE